MFLDKRFKCVATFQELISYMLQKDAEDRYTASELLQHAWLSVSSFHGSKLSFRVSSNAVPIKVAGAAYVSVDFVLITC